MARRLLMFGVLAALSQVGTGCCCVRQCIANRWHHFHGGGCGACTPAFKVPAPVPVFHGPPAAGCPSCYGPPEMGPVALAGPGPGLYPGPGPLAGPAGYPVISPPMPLLNGPTVEPSMTGIPAPMPVKSPN